MLIYKGFHCDDYSLYSTRTQNTWRRGLALGNAPDARILHYPTQNIPTCWHILRWVTHIFRVLPDAFCPTRFTRRQSVEYRWRWAFWRWGWRWACTFHIFCVDFICVWWSTQSQYPVEYGLINRLRKIPAFI